LRQVLIIFISVVFMTAILNKRVLLAGAVIAAVAALALGATYAAWQASDSITGNTVGTAELAIDAVGVAVPGTDPKPIIASNILPGWKSPAAERAEITNNSTVPLDLYFYVENLVGEPGACDAVALAWRASTPGDGSNFLGYGTTGDVATYEATLAGTIASYTPDPVTPGLLTLIENLEGPANAVKIANANNGFGPDQTIAIRQLAHFATDAAYPTHAGTCTWTEVFVGTLPGQTPAVPVPVVVI
jgi:predicted ribosomally synthesized peptide with SipW-like signal peptide